MDANSTPTMVNILDKKATHRFAHARAVIQFPPHVLRALVATTSTDLSPTTPQTPSANETQPTTTTPENYATVREITSAKGPVFSTATVAGTMAVKKTSDLIPFCHPLPIESCKISISVASDTDVVVDCKVQVTHKTGVEMEALVGASVAALTVYDMCKALSHDIVLKDTRLVEKRGGKSDFVKE